MANYLVPEWSPNGAGIGKGVNLKLKTCILSVQVALKTARQKYMSSAGVVWQHKGENQGKNLPLEKLYIFLLTFLHSLQTSIQRQSVHHEGH